MPIGSLLKVVRVSDEYQKVAEEDEQIARLLLSQHRHRHAIYFALQAMEKFVRARIYQLMDPFDPEVIQNQRHHSVDEAIRFLISKVMKDDPLALEQAKEQLNQYLDLNFSHLHNNVRYPFISRNQYNWLKVGYTDAEAMMQHLEFLKNVLRGIDIYIAKKRRTK
jgi:dGTP triphosphohydrolase